MRETLKRFFSLELLDNRYPALHGMRVFAVITVVQFHVTSLFHYEGVKLDPNWVESSMAVFFGMDLFFILSGFLIGSILLHSLTDGAGKLKTIGRFYLRRVFRTFPSYYLVLTGLALHHMTPAQHHNLIYEYVYLTNTRPLTPSDVVMLWGWSLSLEEQFYLVVPFLFLLLQWLKKERLQIALLVLLWVSALAIRTTIWLRYSWADSSLREAIYFQTYTRFDTLVAGIFLAIVHKRYGDVITRFFEAPFHRAVVALVTLFCLWILMEPFLFGPNTVQAVHVLAWGTITSVMYIGWILLLLHSPAGFIARLFSAPIFRKVATLGYGVYLVHLPYCDLIGAPFARALQARHVSMVAIWSLSLGLVLVVSFATAYILHLVIEKPSLWIRDKLAR